MILTKNIKIKLNQFNSHHYKRLGYNVEDKKFIIVKIKDIGKGTMMKVKVQCDICNKTKHIGYRKYFKNILKYGIYSCSNKCSMFKNEKTNLEKYGVKHQCKINSVVDQILKTKLEKGLMSNSYEDFINYRRIVNNLTNRNKKQLFKEWNGKNYYDNECIKNNLILNFNDPKYPTIDHKISVLYGYNNGINVENISSIENLCITKRSNNSLKNTKIEEEFISHFPQAQFA